MFTKTSGTSAQHAVPPFTPLLDTVFWHMYLSQEGIAGVTAGTEWLSSGADVVVGGKVYVNGVTAGEVRHTDADHNHSWQRNASLLSADSHRQTL